MAVSNEWQSRYRIARENNIPFFDGSIKELDINKINFLHFLDYYKKIYELDEDERPIDEVIENMYLCDEWVRIYISNLKKKKREVAHASAMADKNSRRQRSTFKIG